MADSIVNSLTVVMSDAPVPSLEEIQNMKVTDLKKKLKAFGLPTTGNKTELVERLQELCSSSKGDSLGLSFDESQISGLDSIDDGNTTIEDSALLDQDQFSPYMSSLEDDSKVLDSTESKLSSNTLTMPPKKRVFLKTGEDGAAVEKKVILNRTNIAHIDFDINENAESKPKTVISSNNNSESEDKKAVSVTTMSASERLAMRAKRFNVISAATTTTSTNSKFANSRNSKQGIISSTVTPDLDVLKKRAARFGQSVSNVMKQIEQKEKLLKRKCKFGASLAISATSSLDEQEKKRQRAERFGIS